LNSASSIGNSHKNVKFEVDKVKVQATHKNVRFEVDKVKVQVTENTTKYLFTPYELSFTSENQA